MSNMKTDFTPDEPSIKFIFGNILVNILHISFLPPSAHINFDFHCHSSYELHFIYEGKGILELPGETYKIGPGMFFLTGPEIYHKQISEPDSPMAEYCITYDIKEVKAKQKENEFYWPEEMEELARLLKGTFFWIGTDEHGSIILSRNVLSMLD